MQVIKTRNVHQALPEALYQLKMNGQKRDSRNGPVYVAPTPVTTVYEQPRERVLFWEDRDANPFFHFFESLWMLRGQNDVAFLQQFVKRMADFSDDGKTFDGAYGYRWRYHFDTDQLQRIASALRHNPDCRRQVLTMWDARLDLGRTSRDLPCNTHAYFQRNAEGALDMTVCNRSNDIVWGCYGANAVHFSYLQEYLAAMIGCSVGRYWQVSNNWHGYAEVVEPLFHLGEQAYPSTNHGRCPYSNGQVEPYRLINTDVFTWHRDLGLMLENNGCVERQVLMDPFFRDVAWGMFQAWREFKDKSDKNRHERAWVTLGMCCEATDWKKACQEWLSRRDPAAQ